MLLLLLLPVAASGAAPRAGLPGILQQAPQRIEKVFGPARRVGAADGEELRQLRFDPEPWRRLWPDLPRDAEFGITLGPQGEVRAVWLDVNAMIREARTGVSREFRFERVNAFAFFRRIFGRDPTRWQALPLPQGGGGHEGFRVVRFCVDPGLALTYTTYRLGEEWIRLVGDSRCH